MRAPFPRAPHALRLRPAGTHTRALTALLLAATLIALALLPRGGGSATSGPPATAASSAASSARTAVPLAARAQVSAALGAARRAYWIAPTPAAPREPRAGSAPAAGTLQASNPVQGLHASFAPSGVTIATGGATGASAAGETLELSLSPRSLGPRSLEPRSLGPRSTGPRSLSPRSLGPRAPAAARNRVTYARGGVTEWYANGPAGLEQGFTIAGPPTVQKARPPAPPAAPLPTPTPTQPLSLTMTLGANATPALAADGESLTLRRGASYLRYGDLQTTDAKGRGLRTWLALEGNRLSIRVDTQKAAYPLRIDPLIQAGGKLTGADEEGEGLFGTSVALSADGSTLLVGGPHDENPAKGAAWVFVRTGEESWTQQGPKLTGAEAPAGEPGEEEECAEESAEEAGECAFGASVALSADGSTALIGEPSSTSRHGNAWIFKRAGGTWTRTAILSGGPGANEGRFGKSVAISADGTTALIGDPSASGQRGEAWVFEDNGSEWPVQEILTQPEPQHFDHLGRSVALSADGSTALLGAPGAEHYVGAAWAFARAGSSWSQLGPALQGAGETGEGRFGKSVALSGDGETALVGALNDAEGDGAVWPFARGEASFEAQGAPLKGTPGEGDHFGYSLALSGDGTEALVGAPRAPEGGVVRQLTRSGTAWTVLEEALVGSGRAGKGWTGSSVALSGDGEIGSIGASHDNARTGAAWTFAQSAAVIPPPPVVTTVRPGSGPEGTAVRVKGTGFAEAQEVLFGTTPASFTVKSGVTIEAVAPPAAAPGIVDVTVRTPAGTSAVNPEDTFRYTTGKAKGGGSENEEPGGGGGEGPGSGGTGTEGTTTTTTTQTGTGAKTGAGGVLGSKGSAAAAGCALSLRNKHLAVTHRRTVALRLQRTGTGACSGKLTLSFNRAHRGRKPKLQTIGTARFAMGAASSKVLKIDLNKLGRKLFRRHRLRLNASLTFVRTTPAPQLARRASVRLTYKKARKQTRKVTLGR